MKRWKKRLRSVFRKAEVDREMDEELAFHLELEVRKNEAAGMSPEEAKRQAALTFGGVERYKEQVRDARVLSWVGGMSLDFKLGLRMLGRYPGLTIVGGLAIAFAVCVGAGTFEFMSQVFNPKLPLPEGDRVVGVRMWDARIRRPEAHVLHDYVAWRKSVRTVDLGAFRVTARNLVTADGPGEPLGAAEITASGLRVAGVAPQLGRLLSEDDERIGAPLVVVIGHEVWQRRFAGDPSVIGRSVRVGAAQATIVGVMPEDFAYPLAQQMWLPLRVSPLDAPRLEGPSLIIVGRLAEDASLADARAELEAIGRATAAELPETHRYLQPQVVPYASSVLNTSLGISGEIDLATLRQLLPASINAFVLLFLVLVCGNVALLMFARAATRESEIVVRNALGASRRRIVLQLFLEALVLGIIASALGLAAAGYGLRWGLTIVQIQAESVQLPFWFKGSLSSSTLLYAGLLTVIAAGICGVLPALKVTRDLGTRLRQTSAGGGGFRFGGVWTAVIVAQVAITMPLPLVGYAVTAESKAIRAVDVGFDERDFVSLRLELADEAIQPGRGDTLAVRQLVGELAQSAETLHQRLQTEPALAGVTFANRLPRMYHPYRLVEVDAGGAAPLDPRWAAYRVSTATVSTNFFDVLGIRPVAGRVFQPADLKPGLRPIVVNESFVKRVFGGRSAVGRRVRFAPGGEYDQRHRGKDEPWHQIIGVVPDAGMSYGQFDPKIAGIYHPGTPAAMRPLTMALRVNGDVSDVAPRLREVAASVDPRMQIYDIMPMNQIIERELRFYTFWFYITMVLTSIALLLSLAGIYAIMSFTVSQRTREIGIRIALGADARRIVLAVFRKPMRQVGFGIAAGGTVLALLMFSEPTNLNVRNVVQLIVYITIMLLVCMLAWILPTRRALSVQPTEALNAEG